MSIIDASYFRAEINIPGLERPAAFENLGYFITKYEAKYLNYLLGSDFSQDFKEGLNIDPVEERYSELLSVIASESTKESPIANYIYCKYMDDLVTNTSNMGVVKPGSENSSNASNLSKVVRAWNEMVERTLEIKAYIYANAETYPEYDFLSPLLSDNYYSVIYDGRLVNIPEIYVVRNTFDI